MFATCFCSQECSRQRNIPLLAGEMQGRHRLRVHRVDHVMALLDQDPAEALKILAFWRRLPSEAMQGG